MNGEAVDPSCVAVLEWPVNVLLTIKTLSLHSSSPPWATNRAKQPAMFYLLSGQRSTCDAKREECQRRRQMQTLTSYYSKNDRRCPMCHKLSQL